MKMHELLSDKSKWTQLHIALNAKGEDVSPLAHEAVCWCIEGALEKCYQRYDDRVRLAQRIEDEVGDFPYEWNDADGRKYEDVIALLRRLDI